MKDWNWKFFVTPDRLPDLSYFTDPSRGRTVKRNPFRTVRKVTIPGGETFYVKHDIPSTPFQILREFFHSKNESEYESGLWLKAHGIPCVSYCALGSYFPETVLISQELKGYISASEFFHTSSEEQLCVFLHAVAKLVHSLLDQKIRHPDFHSGNLMVKPDQPDHICLLDLYGVRQVRYARPVMEDCHIFADFSSRISPELGRLLMQESGVDPSVFDLVLKQTRKRILREWPRRARQILTGRSKFARMDAIDGEIYYIRNTPWYSPLPFSPDTMRMEEWDPDAAMDQWLSSFRAELLHESKEMILPAAFRPGRDSSFLYYDDTGKD